MGTVTRLARRSRLKGGPLNGEGLRRGALVTISAAMTLVGAEGLLALSSATGPHLHRSDRHVSAAVDCYPSNPRSYFDLDLRDSETRSRLEAAKIRDLGDCSAAAPFAVEFRYNSLQFRDIDRPTRREGVRRIAVLGDSFTEGQGVKEPDTYGRRLEAQLNAIEPGGWEVLNFGRRGADFPALYENFEQLLEYNPDVTVYGMMLNDAARSEPFEAHTARLHERASASRRAHASSLHLLGFLRQRLEVFQTARETTRWYNDLYSEPNAGGWRSTERYLVDMDQRMKRHGGRFVVMLWPVFTDLEQEYPFEQAHAAIGGFCRAAGIEFHDLLPRFRGRPTARLRVHRVDAHPNDLAHEIAATSLRPIVLDLS